MDSDGLNMMDKFVKLIRERKIKLASDPETLEKASRDASQLRSEPIGCVYPNNIQEISEVVKACNQCGIKITIAGGYTGLSGGVLGENAIRIETRQMNKYHVDGNTVHAQAGASIPDIMRSCGEVNHTFPCQPGSACMKTDVYENYGTMIGPVTVGGSIGVNASGFVSCKLGPLGDWVEKMTIVDPKGEIKEISSKNEMSKYIGTEGRYGIIGEADIKIYPTEENSNRYGIINGIGINSFSKVTKQLGEAENIPLMTEGFVQMDNPPDLKILLSKIYPKDSEEFIKKYDNLFGPNRWFIQVEGSNQELDGYKHLVDKYNTINTNDPSEYIELDKKHFDMVKFLRASAHRLNDMVSKTKINKNLKHPIIRASQFLSEAIEKFRINGIEPKQEHNYGLLWIFLTDNKSRIQHHINVSKGLAFDDGSVEVYNKCDGNIGKFFQYYLSPKITDEIKERKKSINFPGNEDLLINTEEMPKTIKLLNSLNKKYGACPVPFLYCHLNFRKNKGKMLVHNRLLFDIREFN